VDGILVVLVEDPPILWLEEGELVRLDRYVVDIDGPCEAAGIGDTLRLLWMELAPWAKEDEEWLSPRGLNGCESEDNAEDPAWLLVCPPRAPAPPPRSPERRPAGDNGADMVCAMEVTCFLMTAWD
jgi:hypothetical protein